MQFQIPQFIEIEDKIFGPLTFKQFLYLAGGVGMCLVIYKTVPFAIAILLIVLLGGFSLALAFYKVNNKPFIDVVESAIRYTFNKKLYIWKKTDKKITPKESGETPADIFVPRLSESKLKDIAWSLDVHESIYASGRRTEEPRIDNTPDQINKQRIEAAINSHFSNPQ